MHTIENPVPGRILFNGPKIRIFDKQVRTSNDIVWPRSSHGQRKVKPVSIPESVPFYIFRRYMFVRSLRPMYVCSYIGVYLRRLANFTNVVLYETFWNVASVVTSYEIRDYHDYVYTLHFSYRQREERVALANWKRTREIPSSVIFVFLL